MISHRCGGGVGNQLFNYAAARTLADRHGTDLILDAVEYRDHPRSSRPFVLHRFPTRARFKNLGVTTDSCWLGARAWRWLKEDALVEHVARRPDEIAYFTNFVQLGSRVRLIGHFIDPRFFSGNDQAIARDLALSESVLGDDRRLMTILEQIRRADAVAVHVRRGDLLAPGNEWLRLPRMEVYYANAIQAVLRCRPFPELFVFSDDPDWCETRFGAFGLPMSVVSSHGAEDPLADFFLMTQCRAFIIANSAYSWWAAWLCRASDKIVMAPCRWETRGLLDMDRFIPEGWTKIEW